MILVAHEKGSKELLPLINKFGVKAEISQLPYGDFCFEGNGPDGRITVGVERKTLHDMLHCIDDSRYSGYQKPGMAVLYDLKYLVLEGIFKPHDQGFLMEGNKNGQYWVCKPGGKPVMYSKLRRYLYSIGLSGVTVTYSRDIEQTAYDLCEMYHYFNKAWDKHTSMIEIPKIALPCITGDPPLVLKWAADLKGVGVKLAQYAQFKFRSGYMLAHSEEKDWREIHGIGPATAKSIIKEIRG